MTMTISTLFDVVLTAVGQGPRVAGLALDNARKSNEPAAPPAAAQHVARRASAPATSSLFELSLPGRGAVKDVTPGSASNVAGTVPTRLR